MLHGMNSMERQNFLCLSKNTEHKCRVPKYIGVLFHNALKGSLLVQ